MTALPSAFHLGPLTFHVYGLGLAIAAYVTFAYAQRRLRTAGVDVTLFGRLATILVISGLIGARVANILTNWSYYDGHPGRWLAVWQGGLASFGGLVVAVPVGLWWLHRSWPDVRWVTVSDALVVAIIAGWALGRVLGPQFMVGGGGHVTSQWWGMTYHGQVGRRVPVPLIQGCEDGALWCALLALEARWHRRYAGQLTAVGMMVWGLVRSLDEHWLLGGGSNAGSLGVEVAGLGLALGGVALWIYVLRTARSIPASSVH